MLIASEIRDRQVYGHSRGVMQTAGSSWLPVRIQPLAGSEGTTVTVTGLRRMPVDIAVRSVCSLG